MQLTRQNYAAKIERVDYWLGEYMGWIEAAGQLARTLVCLASDHGEMLGDRQTTAKSKPWQSAMSVPIVCRAASPGSGTHDRASETRFRIANHGPVTAHCPASPQRY